MVSTISLAAKHSEKCTHCLVRLQSRFICNSRALITSAKGHPTSGRSSIGRPSVAIIAGDSTSQRLDGNTSWGSALATARMNTHSCSDIECKGDMSAVDSCCGTPRAFQFATAENKRVTSSSVALTSVWIWLGARVLSIFPVMPAARRVSARRGKSSATTKS